MSAHEEARGCPSPRRQLLLPAPCTWPGPAALPSFLTFPLARNSRGVSAP